DPRLKDVPTLNELMQQYKTPDSGKRLAKVVLTAATLGRPISAPPGTPVDRTKILRSLHHGDERSGVTIRSRKTAMGGKSVDRRRARVIGERGHRSTSRSHRTDEMGLGTIKVIERTRRLRKKNPKKVIDCFLKLI